MKLSKKLCSFFSIDKEMDDLEVALKNVEKQLAISMETSNALASSLTVYESMYSDYMNKKAITEAIERCTPDMQWAKDLHGKYLYANEAIKCGLLMSPEPLGQTDLEIAGIRKTKESDAGETCYGSDLEVLQNMKPMRFIERFSINGTSLVLDVHKAPMYDKDRNCIGTAGIGRDITRLHELFTELKKEISFDKVNSRRKSDIIMTDLQELLEVYSG